MSRRTLLAAGLASAMVLPSRRHSARAVTPGAWHTWLLESVDELRPPAPAASSNAEIGELLDLRERRTADTAALIERWNSGPAVLPWTDLTLKLIKAHRPSPVRAGRALALVLVATADAAIAARDAQDAYQRAAPATVEPQIEPVIDGGYSSFPSEFAAVAGAAEVVLRYLFPSEPAELFAALADEAISSRLWAGVNFRSDVEVGRAMGRTIGERAASHGRTDGSDVEWDGSGRLTGPGYWEPTPPAFMEEPIDPLAGTWQPWVFANVDSLRPPPPPRYESPTWQAELAAVHDAVAHRTPEQEAAVHFWAGLPGTVTPAGLWTEIARDLIVRDGLDTPHASRVLAMTSVAIADGFLSCWDAKYTYWTARPITADPALNVLIPTPPFPSYTSGHSTVSAAAATVLGHLFPDDAEALSDRAEEAKASRLWAGIHFPIDNDMGATVGGQIGRLVIDVAREVT